MVATPKTAASKALDKTTTISIGILVLLISAVAGGSFQASALMTKVDVMEESLHSVKGSIDKITSQIGGDGKSLVLLDALMQSLERRVRDLELKVK